MSTPVTAPSAQPLSAAPSIHGRILWHELLTHDVAAATTFYPAVIGWNVTSMEVPGGPGTYTIFGTATGGQAGVTPYPPEQAVSGQPPRWVPYFGSDDVEATCRDATALGATAIVPVMDVPTVGRIAMLADPEGALFAVIQPYPAGTPETVPVAGEFTWHEMIADDPDKSMRFYMALFGWVLKHSMDMGEHGMYHMFGRGEFMYGGFMRRTAMMPASNWNSYVRITDLDHAVEVLKAHGGKVMMGPHEVPNDDRVVVAVDNQGAVISLVASMRA